MKSFRAAALRLILPLLFRGATVDFFGTADVFDFFETDDDEDFVEVLFGFDDVLFGLFAEDDERVDERELDEPCEPPFWATAAKGDSKAMIVMRAMRLSIENPLL